MVTAANLEDPNDGGGEYKKPDAAKAFDIYDKQIKPKLTKIDTARGELSQPWQDIKEHANFPRPVMNFLIALENIEDDAKRDHFLLALSGGLTHRKLFLPRDLVTMADGNDGGQVVPTEERPELKLVGVDDDDDFEASEEEIAGQKPRADEAEARKTRKGSAPKPADPPAEDEGFVDEDEEQPEAAE